MFDHRWPLNVFGQNISRVVGAGDLGQGKGAASDLVLHPEICGCKVPDFPKSPAPTDPNGSCGISLDLQRPTKPEVGCNADQAEADGGTLTDAPSSASPEERLTVGWVFAQCLIRW